MAQRASKSAFSTLLLLVAAVTFAADLSNAVQQAQEKFNAGQYRETVQLVSVSLSGRQPDSDNSERYSLLLLKGESLIQLKQVSAAAQAFDQASQASSDPKEAGWARANMLVLRASTGTNYVPKVVGGSPIDIVNPETRKQAFAALRDDLMRSTEPRVQGALEGKTLPPMFDLIPKVLDQGCLEFATEGSAPKARETLVSLGKRARELMTSELSRIRHRVNILQDVSNASEGNWNNDYTTRRGLYSNEQKELRESVKYLDQIEKTARDARSRARSLGFQGEAWEPIIADARDLADLAQALLDLGK